MDAASNNSVDDIRDLRESVAYAPVSGRRKVYILDEAHMLSTAAWNAFLKTLEEPPPNTVFVLATTEANKVPATVVDRCHRFDFHRPTVEQIAFVVRRAAAAESIEIPPEAVAALARSATGSFRDALGTLEQILTYGGPRIALEDVLAVLGVADARLLEQTVDAVAAGDSRGALHSLEECSKQGRDAASFASDLEVRVRELLVVQTLGEVPAELSLTPEADAALLAQAERVEHATVVRLLELIGEAMEAVRAGADARTRLELALVKAARPEVDGSMRALLARIERLEQGRGTGGAPSGGDPGTAPDRDASVAAAIAGRAPDSAPAAAEEEPQAEREPRAGREPRAEAQRAPTPDAPAASPPRQAKASGGEAAVDGKASGGQTPAAEPAARDLESISAMWPAVVELVRGENALLGALIAEARPVAAQGDDLVLAFASTAQFLKKKAEDPANRMTVGEALRAITGARWRLSYELRDQDAEESAAPSGEESEEEWVRRFMEEFDAEEVLGEWDSQPGEGAAQQAERGARAVTSNEKGA